MKKIVSIKYDNIIDDHFLLNDHREPHKDIVTCIPHFFERKDVDAVCLDFTSLNPHPRNLLRLIIYTAIQYSRENKIPFFLMPLAVLNYDYIEDIIKVADYPLMIMDHDGKTKWSGKASNHQKALNQLMTDEKSISKMNALNHWGQDTYDYLQTETLKGGSFIHATKNFFKALITIKDIEYFLEQDFRTQISHGLITHNSIRTMGHFIIAENKIHTDTILLIERAINESNRAITKIIYRLSKMIRNNYDLVICDKRLKAIAEMIGNQLKCPVAIADTNNNKIEAKYNKIGKETKNAIILESIIRTGHSVNNIFEIATNNGFNITNVFSLFGYKKKFKFAKFECEVLYDITCSEWKNEKECPLCVLGYKTREIFREANIDDKVDINKRTTPHHFWKTAIETNSIYRGSGHVTDEKSINEGKEEIKYSHCYYDYIDISKFLSGKNKDIIARHLLMRLFHEVKIKREDIRYIVFKESEAAKILAQALSDLIDGYVNIRGIKPQDVEKMSLDPQTKWTPYLFELSKELKGQVILVDDCINRGWTLNRFIKYFRTAQIDHVATVVVINKEQREKGSFTSNEPPVIEYYRPSLPVWNKDNDCPICLQRKRIEEISAYHIDEDTRKILSDKYEEMNPISIHDAI